MLASGALVADPQRREGQKGPFAIATIRAADGDEPALVSGIAFGENAERLLGFVKGDALAVSGRARLTSWTGRDGAKKHGVSIVADQIAAAKPRPKTAAGARRQSPRGRKVSAFRPPRSSGPPLADDRLDDLWRESIP
jgi:single-stranded DNA-binding protein